MNNDIDDLMYATDESPYHLGFVDGVEDSFNRVIKYVNSELKKNYTDQVNSTLKDMLTKLEKMKNRT